MEIHICKDDMGSGRVCGGTENQGLKKIWILWDKNRRF